MVVGRATPHYTGEAVPNSFSQATDSVRQHPSVSSLEGMVMPD